MIDSFDSGILVLPEKPQNGPFPACFNFMGKYSIITAFARMRAKSERQTAPGRSSPYAERPAVLCAPELLLSAPDQLDNAAVICPGISRI